MALTFHVVSVSQAQGIDAAGNLEDEITATYTIEGRPGSFTVTVPQSGDFVAAVAAKISGLNQGVEAIYGLG